MQHVPAFSRPQTVPPLRIDPRDAEVGSNLGSIYLRQGLTAKAISEYREALPLGPQFTEARKNLELAESRQASPNTGSPR